MCGLAGFWDTAHALRDDDRLEVVSRMADALRHRGPDDGGVWTDGAAGVALGFRRLAIVDLSPEGRQPMFSASGRYVLVFNGEIYNYQDLRKELKTAETTPFRGRSDTEVMLACFEHWGVERSLKRFAGMFAFAVWDQHQRQLHLARDRMGEKPLYYGRMGKTFLFGSELKALRIHPDFRGTIDRRALALYLRHGYIPTPYAIFEGLRKLPPASLLTLQDDQTAPPPEPVPYWSHREAAEAGEADPFPGTALEAVEELEELLKGVVQREMIADVPLGALLSGGIDSSTVVALMQAQSTRPVKTFTIGFHEQGYDEAVYAKAVARHLGTEHTELYLTPEEARDVIPGLPALFDEPFADSSAIPTFLVSQLARRGVTVALSGDGGDELFGGYSWYQRTPGLWRQVAAAPRPLRKAVATVLESRSAEGWDCLLKAVRPVLPFSLRRRFSGDRAHKLADLIGHVEGPEQLHRILTSHWNGNEVVVGKVDESPTLFSNSQAWAHLKAPVDRLMFLDQATYLPDDILTKVDRTSMGVSLELRAPFLDHEVVEFAWRIPSSWKFRDGRGKWPIRQLLYRHVPEHLIERPKMGFSIPLAVWLRGPLRDWGEALLAEDRLRAEGFLNPDTIRKRWYEHQAGQRDWSGPLWVILSFQSWLEYQS